MNALSRREEDSLLKATKAYALKQCDPVVKEFADCMSGRLISVAWACKDKLRVVEKCMIQYTGPESMDVVRGEYLKLRNQRQEEKRQMFDQSSAS
ncbi:uncharacterized protein ARMOST_09115 [Armillaria ostoyae]|uniref:COX assembly mitochondrial protein n=3 Tax=Armillaria TaxID=47424 RepID=A0A284RAL3_ARMOS|nr:hypothetical protein EV421DRAFT_60389 [Armillaria borealis]PBK77202.1 hypothetical protein ARMSODRAFT_949103 [Armillaria solidipes]SJL05779.1 uncharacterized protein ARMOST_09115 [Armillaria ostoyae]